MADKIMLLRQLVDEVGLASPSDLAERWGVSREAVRQFMDDDDAPAAIITSQATRLYALPEADAYRTRRLKRAKEGQRRKRTNND